MILSKSNKEFIELIDKLKSLNILKIKNNIIKIDSRYRAGRINIFKTGNAILETLLSLTSDIFIDANSLNNAKRGDLVIVKRDFYATGKPSGKVVLIVQKQYPYSVGYINQEKEIVDIKTELTIQDLIIDNKIKNNFEYGTILKIDNNSNHILDILGNIKDNLVDEKISLTLFNKVEEFSENSKNIKYEDIDSENINENSKNNIKKRIDLRDLPFVTIDPVTAKDHDDAIYFDNDKKTLYVAIADVTHYVEEHSSLDKEAKKRGFTIYFPHKSIPMLPRTLSENLCSLKEGKDRLAFTFKIIFDDDFNIKEYQLFEAIIKSKKSYSYDNVDHILNSGKNSYNLIDFFKIAKILRKRRLKNGFNFQVKDFRLHLDDSLELSKIEIEKETDSHIIVEEAMLLANCCAGNMLKDNGIFRIHNTPSIAKIDELTLNLAQIGIVVKQNAEDGIHKFILSIQERAKEVNLEEEVNRLIIKAQKQAVYDSKNIGHFGLGFEVYSHFTSPIRRYSDLILHRLLKNISTQDIDSIAKQVSLLERETDKVAKDYEARVYARWAEKNLNKIFSGNVIDNENKTIIELKSNGCKIKIDTYLNLFEDIQIKIISSNLFTTEILGIISDDI